MKRFTAFVFAAAILLSLSGFSEAVSLRGSASFNITNDGVTALSGATVESTSFHLMPASKAINDMSPVSESFAIFSGTLPSVYNVIAVKTSSIEPRSGYNTGSISVKINGTGFLAGASARLRKTGYSDVIATSISVESITRISCIFDLTGLKSKIARLGEYWDVVVTNPDGVSDVLVAGFEVKTWAGTGLAVNYPNPFDPTVGPTKIVYELTAATDTLVLIFNQLNELIWKTEKFSGNDGGKLGTNLIEWNGYNGFGEMCANGLYFLRIIDRQNRSILAKGRIGVSK